MKICVAQTRPVTGIIQQNVNSHKTFINQAISHGAEAIIFPELSLTGYEPALARDLAIHPDDARLDDFQKMADSGSITIGVGAPIHHSPRPNIGLILFRPLTRRRIYSKQYLHSDEEPYFSRGERSTGFFGEKNEAALAICFELSVREHAAAAFRNGAKIYLASVAKFTSGVQAARRRLAAIAQQYGMIAIMANAVGPAAGGRCAGQSAVWQQDGSMVGKLDDTSEGILIYDTASRELFQEMI